MRGLGRSAIPVVVAIAAATADSERLAKFAGIVSAEYGLVK